MRNLVLALLICLETTAGAVSLVQPGASPASNPAADQDFAALAARYIDATSRLSPIEATLRGDHRFDTELPDLSAAGRATSVEMDRDILAHLGRIDRAKLSRDDQIDAAILENAVRFDLWDPPSNRLIAACANRQAAIVDAGTRHLQSLLPIGEGPDGVIVDAPRRRAFIPCGRSGSLEILALDAPQGPVRLAPLPTETSARLGALDPATGAVYLPSARFGALVPPARRPPIVPGSFHLLRIEPR